MTNKNQKYQKIIDSVLSSIIADEQYQQPNKAQFLQLMSTTITAEINIPFIYSKYFEDYFKEQMIQIIYQESLETLKYWEIFLSNLRDTSYIIQDTYDFLYTSLENEISEKSKVRPTLQIPTIQQYEEIVNEKISIIHEKSKIYYKEQESLLSQYPQTLQQSLQNANMQLNDNILPPRLNAKSESDNTQDKQFLSYQNQTPIQTSQSQSSDGAVNFLQKYNNVTNINNTNNFQINNYNNLEINNQNFRNTNQNILFEQQQMIINRNINNNMLNNKQPIQFNSNQGINHNLGMLTNNNNSNTNNNILRNNNGIYQVNQNLNPLMKSNLMNNFQRIQNNQSPYQNINRQINNFMVEAYEEAYEEANSELFQTSGRCYIENEKQIDLESDVIIEIEKYDSIDRQLIAIYNNNILLKQGKQQLLTFANYIINFLHANIVNRKGICDLKANIYGSFFQGTCLNKDSDIDVIINLENIYISYRDALSLIQSICYKLDRSQYTVEHVITQRIRIPFISITKNITKQKIDLIYDNPLGIMNSNLFFTYLNIDEKIKILCVLFKLWAGYKNIKDKYKLTSYALMNMVLHFLIKEKYIESLQDGQFFEFKEEQKRITAYCCMQQKQYEVYPYFAKDLNEIRSKLLQKGNFTNFQKTPIHQLFVKLMRFYQNYASQVLSGQQLYVTTRPSSMKMKNYDTKWISIQDPFDDDYNPGSRKSFQLFDLNSQVKQIPNQINENDIKRIFS